VPLFDDLFASAAVTDLKTLGGETVTHNPAGGTSADVTSIRWTEDQTLAGDRDDGSQDLRMGTLRLEPADLASIGMEDTFTIDEVTWAVTAIGERRPVLVLTLETRTDKRAGGNRRGG